MASSRNAKTDGEADFGRDTARQDQFLNTAEAMNRSRMHIFYSGHVQGVGFRFTVKKAAAGFEVTGVVRNLPDGRVELVAEGDRKELEAFRAAIPDAGLAACIRHEDANWSEAQGGFRGFEIVR